jgi:hypothetical protein
VHFFLLWKREHEIPARFDRKKETGNACQCARRVSVVRPPRLRCPQRSCLRLCSGLWKPLLPSWGRTCGWVFNPCAAEDREDGTVVGGGRTFLPLGGRLPPPVFFFPPYIASGAPQFGPAAGPTSPMSRFILFNLYTLHCTPSGNCLCAHCVEAEGVGRVGDLVGRAPKRVCPLPETMEGNPAARLGAPTPAPCAPTPFRLLVICSLLLRCRVLWLCYRLSWTARR